MNLNKDHPGPQQIRVLKYNASHWEAVESLTRGYFYYHNRVEKSQPMFVFFVWLLSFVFHIYLNSFHFFVVFFFVKIVLKANHFCDNYF